VSELNQVMATVRLGAARLLAAGRRAGGSGPGPSPRVIQQYRVPPAACPLIRVGPTY